MRSKSFSNIIEDYEVKISQGKKEAENTCTNNLIGVSGPPQYEGSYSRITGGDETVERRLPSKNRHKLMTFTEFMKKKS